MVKEDLDYLLSRPVLASQREQNYAYSVLRLRREYFKNIEMKKEYLLTWKVKSGGIASELAELREQGIEISQDLRQIFTDRVKRGGQ